MDIMTENNDNEIISTTLNMSINTSTSIHHNDEVDDNDYDNNYDNDTTHGDESEAPAPLRIKPQRL
jgi:hypothetical protein